MGVYGASNYNSSGEAEEGTMPSTRLETVTMRFLEDVQVEPGITIPAADYAGFVKEVGLDSGRASTTYHVELDGTELERFGAQASKFSMSYDVSSFVEARLVVTVDPTR
jgi:hypothetical protein